jgi:hypothetical protein
MRSLDLATLTGSYFLSSGNTVSFSMRSTFLLFLSLFLCSPYLFAQHNEVILFISDTQQPMLIETIRLKTQQNERMTQRLFSMMAKETTAASLFHLGDITSMGMMNSCRKTCDTLRTTLTFPVYPRLRKSQVLLFFSSLEKFQIRSGQMVPDMQHFESREKRLNKILLG